MKKIIYFLLLLTFNSNAQVVFPTLDSKLSTQDITVNTTLTEWNKWVGVSASSNITINLPTAIGNAGKQIVFKRNDVTSNIVIIDGFGSETIDGQSTITIEANTSVTIYSDGVNCYISASSLPTSSNLTSGRVNALLDLASTTHINTDPGTKIPFTGTVYTNGTTVNVGSITPSVAGRYRADWLCMAASTEFLADGIFFVVQNGVSVGQVSYNMNEASAVNQSAGFINVDLVAGQEVSLHYRTRHTASDGISWDRGSYFQLTQLPTAVAPVVNTVAEYGEQVLTSSVTIPSASTNATNATDILSFTLPSAGVWEVEYNVRATTPNQTATSVTGMVALITNSANTTQSNSEVVIGRFQSGSTSGSGNSLGLSGSGVIKITTTGAETFKIRGHQDGSANGSLAYSVQSDGNGRTKVSWTKIAGQLPSTGQTVDYINLNWNNGSSNIVATGAKYDFSGGTGFTQNGNISFTLSTATFSLTAGKTYRLTANGATEVATGAGWAWYDDLTNTRISNSAFSGYDNGTLGQPNSGIAEIVITPTSNMTVSLRGAVIGSSQLNLGRTSIVITQLGSSAVYAGVYPGTWVTYTPTITATASGTNPTLPTSATITGSYSIQGKTMFLNVRYSATATTGGTAGTQSYAFGLPGGYTIDLTKVPLPTDVTNTSLSGFDGSTVGSGFSRNASSSSGVIAMPVTSTGIGLFSETSARLIGAGAIALNGASNTIIGFTAQIPIN